MCELFTLVLSKNSKVIIYRSIWTRRVHNYSSIT